MKKLAPTILGVLILAHPALAALSQPDSMAIQANEPFGIRFAFHDPVGGTLSFAVFQKPSWLELVGQDSLAGLPDTVGYQNLKVILSMNGVPKDTMHARVFVSPYPSPSIVPGNNERVDVLAIQHIDGPSRHFVFVLSLPTTEPYSFRAYNLQGQRVWSKSGQVDRSKRITLTRPNARNEKLSSGIYFCLLTQGNKKVFRKALLF